VETDNDQLPPTLCASASATVTNRSSQAGQPTSTHSVRRGVPVLNTIVEFMIVPFCLDFRSYAAAAAQASS
jgi:hypothetical protein